MTDSPAGDFLKLRSKSVRADEDIGIIEKKFLEAVRKRIQDVAENYDEDEVKKEEEWIASFHNDFFQYTLRWAAANMQAHKEAKQVDDAARLKAKAKEILEELQSNLITYATCYMHINRYQTLLRDEIEKDRMKGHITPSDMKWTSDIGVTVHKSKAAKDNLTKNLERTKKARALLEDREDDLKAVFEAIEALHGKDKGPAFQRSLRSAIRMKDFDKARQKLKEIRTTRKKFKLGGKSDGNAEKLVSDKGAALIDFFEENQETLQDSEGKLLLLPKEADSSYNSYALELKKVKDTLNKYYFPYMQHKINNLVYLKDKLTVAGTLDSLMVLYLKLIKGMALPITDIKDARDFESDVLQNVQYLLGGQFQEIPKILQRAEDSVNEFRENRKDLDELENMDLTEIETKGDEGDELLSA